MEGSDSDDSGSEDEYEKKQALKDARDFLSQNPRNWDAHLEVIKCLRALADLDGLLKAQFKMSSRLPIYPKMWLEWINERKRVTDVGDESVIKMFEQAVEDYRSADLWCQYLTYAWEAFSDDHDKIRKLAERAAETVGRDIREGWRVWKMYRDLEKQILVKTAQAGGGSMTSDTQAQFKRITRLYTRQLALPTWDGTELFNEYKEWLKNYKDSNGKTQKPDSGVVTQYQKVAKWLSKFRSHEERLQELDKPAGPGEGDKKRLEEWVEYIGQVVAAKDTKHFMIVSLYERMISECFLTDQAWIEYLGYMASGKDKPELHRQAKRAVRNVPFSEGCWQFLLTALEWNRHPLSELEGAKKDAFKHNLTHGGRFEVTLALADTTRRLAERVGETEGNEEKKKELLEKAKKHYTAAEALLPKCMNTERASQLYRSMEKLARLLGEDVAAPMQKLVKCQGKNAKTWQRYIESQTRAGATTKRVRGLFKVALNNVPVDGGLMYLLKEFIEFERLEGTADSIASARVEFQKRYLVIQRKAKKMAGKKRQQAGQQKGGFGGKPQKGGFGGKPKQRKAAVSFAPARASGGGSAMDADQPARPLKRPRDAKDSEGQPGKKLRKLDSKSKSATASTSAAKGEDEKAGDEDDEKKDEYNLKVAFVLNLPKSTTVEDLCELFGDCGPVLVARIPKDKGGTVKGFGYVEFKKENSCQAAIRKFNNFKWRKRVLRVERCRRHADKARSQANVVFVRGIKSLYANKAQNKLRAHFKGCGEVAEIRAPTDQNRRDRLKGFAFVEFKAPESVEKALELNGQKLEGTEISLEITKYEKKGGKKVTKKFTAFQPRALSLKNKQRRNLKVKAGGSKKAEPEASTSKPASAGATSERKNLGQDDFRKMLGL